VRRSTFFTATATAAALAGGVSAAKSNCESIQSYDNNSLFVPTLEAGIRALRLVRTAGIIVMDYEIAKMKLFTAIGGKEEMELMRLEQETADREMELEQAQMEYASGTEENVKVSSEQRKALKAKQKQRMQNAAKELAEAEEAVSSMEGESAKSRLHRKGAKRLLELCMKNGGVYIKVGQHLANLDYLIPQEYIEVLSSLFDEAPQSDYVDVCRVIEEELQGTVDVLFDNFDPVPIASASLAQVHVAYDKETGQKLAVKVQHAGLRETSVGDIFAVTCVVRLVETFFKDFTFGWIADEIAPNLPKELDFAREGKNSERAAEHLKDSGLECVVPIVIWDRTASRVLTMSFEEGFKSTDIDALEESGLNKQ
jgi:predicted unusual protein kinase regulating ubiquinone biosynthesis (AarF/ABC1/UbiB family)